MATSPTASPQRISITICGDGGCGKSSITLRLVRSQWTSGYDPTIEDSYSVSRTVDGASALLSLTDTAGQEEYRGLISSSSLSSDAFLLVYDITNPSSLHEQLPYFLDLVQQERETRAEGIARPAHPGADGDWGAVEPIVIVAGNKCDLKDERQVSAREGLEWARARGCGFMETSARECVNVEETFALIVRRVREAREHYVLAKSGRLPRGAAASAFVGRGVGGQAYPQGEGGFVSPEHAGGVDEKKGLFDGLKEKSPVFSSEFWKTGRWWRWAKCW